MSTFHILEEAFAKHTMPKEIQEVIIEKQNQTSLKALLAKYHITSLWHFTDRANISSIKKHGILSLANLKKKNIDISHTASSELSHSIDRIKRLDHYVHLSFIQDHPLYHVAISEKRLVDPVWIEIDISILFDQKTRFCNQVANKKGAKILSVDKIEKVIDFDIMLYSKDFDQCKEVRKAEVLIADYIPVDKIIGVHDGKKTYIHHTW